MNDRSPSRMHRRAAPRHVAVILGLVGALLVALPSAAAPKAELWERWTAHDPAATRTVDHGLWDAFLRTHVRAHPSGSQSDDEETRIRVAERGDGPIVPGGLGGPVRAAIGGKARTQRAVARRLAGAHGRRSSGSSSSSCVS